MSYKPRHYILSAFEEPVGGSPVNLISSSIELLSNGAGPVAPDTANGNDGSQAGSPLALSLSAWLDAYYIGDAILMLMITDIAGATVSVTAAGLTFTLLKTDTIAFDVGTTTFQWWRAPITAAYGNNVTVALSEERGMQFKIQNFCNVRTGYPIGLSYLKSLYAGPLYQTFINPASGSMLFTLARSTGGAFNKSFGLGTTNMLPADWYNFTIRSSLNT
jgi:hypothetical protein